MSRDRKTFTLGGIVKVHSLDDVQARLLLDVENCMNAMCPDTGARPPAALHELHLAICLLCDWTSRTDRGRSRLRSRYLAIIANMEEKLKADNSNLLDRGAGVHVVPAILQAVIAADDKEAATVSSAEIADAVDAWLTAEDKS